jgi:hypothetical protein
MATIGQIADGESGSSVRTKLNSSIDEVNKVIDKAEALIDIVKVNDDYTLLETDNGKRVQCTSSSLITITLPDGLSTGFHCQIEKAGDGNVLTSATTLLRAANGYDRIYTQYEVVNIYHEGSDIFTADRLEQDPALRAAEDLVQPLELLAATGLQTLTVTAGYSISEIAVVYADISGTAVISIGTSVSGQQIMKRKEFNVSTPFAYITRGFMPQAGISSNWTIHLTTVTSLVNVYIKTSKLIS